MVHDSKDVAAEKAGARHCQQAPSVGPAATALAQATK